MESSLEPEVVIQLQKQTTTAHLSDNEFTSKAAAAAGRIKAWLPAQLSAEDEQRKLASTDNAPKGHLRKLATIAEDDIVEFDVSLSRGNKKLLSILNTPQNNKMTHAHPGEILSIPPQLSFANLKSIVLGDVASDVTVRPSLETGSTAAEPKLTPSPQKTFLTQNADGSYKEVDISEVAPWLYQDDQDAGVPAKTQQATYKTPPSTLSRASTAGGFQKAQVLGLSAGDKRVWLSPSNVVKLTITCRIKVSPTSSTTATPKTATPGSRRSSIKGILTPSPGLRKVGSKLSLTGIRVSSLRADSSFQRDPVSPSSHTFLSPTTELGDSDSSSSTAGVPYEDMPPGPAPRTEDVPSVLASRNEDIDSIRARRGFRPLSVITGAVNYSIDPFPAMEQAELLRLVEEDRKNGGTYHDPLRNSSSDTVVFVPKESPPDTTDIRKVDEAIVAFSSSTGTAHALHSDAFTLFNTPPPLLADHPLNREGEDPFEVRTLYPLMTTSTPPPLVKALARNMNQLSSKSTSFVDDVRKKKSYRNLGGLFTRSAPPTQLNDLSELSPVILKNTLQTRTSDESGATAPSSIGTPTFGSASSRAKRLRKVSAVFKRDTGELDGVANSPVSIQTPTLSTGKKGKSKLSLGDKHKFGSAGVENSREKKSEVCALVPRITDSEEDEAKYLERWLRNHLAYPRKKYKSGKWPHYPPHPNHKMAWDHTNLRCKACIESYCGCCGRTCCAYRALIIRLVNLPEEKVRERQSTLELKQAIETLYSVPIDEPTFLQCTDCKKMTCPNCCGICPIEGCHDTECRKCKKGDPWNPCSLHEKEGTPNSSVGSNSKGSSEEISSMSPMSPQALAVRKQCLDSLEEKNAREEMKGAPPAFWHEK